MECGAHDEPEESHTLVHSGIVASLVDAVTGLLDTQAAEGEHEHVSSLGAFQEPPELTAAASPCGWACQVLMPSEVGDDMECVGPKEDVITVMVSDQDDDMLNPDRNYFMKHTYNCEPGVGKPSMQQMLDMHLDTENTAVESAKQYSSTGTQTIGAAAAAAARESRRSNVIAFVGSVTVCSTILLVLVAFAVARRRRNLLPAAPATPAAAVAEEVLL
jgi:hypothetical protein